MSLPANNDLTFIPLSGLLVCQPTLNRLNDIREENGAEQIHDVRRLGKLHGNGIQTVLATVGDHIIGCATCATSRLGTTTVPLIADTFVANEAPVPFAEVYAKLITIFDERISRMSLARGILLLDAGNPDRASVRNDIYFSYGYRFLGNSSVPGMLGAIWQRRIR